MSESEAGTDTPDNAQLPGTSGTTNVSRRPYCGKRKVVNAVDVRFTGTFVVSPWDAGELVIRPGDALVVETPTGQRIGRAVGLVTRRVMMRADVRRVVRRATDADLEQWAQREEQAREAMRVAARIARDRRIDAKVVQVDVPLDGRRATVFYAAERRVNLRDMPRRLASELNLRVELRQVGLREGTGMVGGIGPCGNDLCCSSFLTSFAAVSIRYAKDQGISLNPQKITGMCGRLKCCLVYEHGTYKELKRYAPRRKKGVLTPEGRANIFEVDVVNRTVRVSGRDGAVWNFHVRDIVVMDRPWTWEELSEGISREQSILERRRQRRGMTRDPKADGMSRGAAAVLQEDYMWADTGSDATLDESSGTPPDGAKKKRRRSGRRRRGGDGESGGGGGSEAKTQGGGQSNTAPDGGDATPKRRRRRRASGGDGSQPKQPGASQEASASGGERRTGESGAGDAPRRRRRRRGGRRRSGEGGGGDGGGGGGEGGGGSGGGSGGAAS